MKLAVIAVAIVEKPIGESVPEDMGVRPLCVTATELAAFIVPEWLYIGVVGKPLDDVPDGVSRHLVGLP